MQFSPLQLLLFQKKIKELGYRKASEKCGIPVSLISYIRRNADRSYEEDTINKIAFLLDMKPYFSVTWRILICNRFLTTPNKKYENLLILLKNLTNLYMKQLNPPHDQDFEELDVDRFDLEKALECMYWMPLYVKGLSLVS